jgi:hypothetical protein
MSNPFPGPNTSRKKKKQKKERGDRFPDDELINSELFVASKKIRKKV